MVVTALKQFFKKQESRTIEYRSHKNFCDDGVRSQLLHELNNGLIKISCFDYFNANVLDNEAPKRMKYVRENKVINIRL